MSGTDSESHLSLEEVLARRLDLAKETLGWGETRAAGFRAGLAEGRAGKPDHLRAGRHDPDSHGFVEPGLDPVELDALGYRDGLDAAESLTRDTVDYSRDPDGMMREVEFWSRNGDKGFDIDDADWTSTTADDLSLFLAVMDRDAWISWFVEEHRAAVADGRPGYGDLLLQDIHAPVIYVAYRDGRIDVWDGFHRIGAAMLKGAGGIPSIKGEPVAEPAFCP